MNLVEPGGDVNVENDAAINRKVHAALAHDLTPIICVGENLAQNEAGQTQVFVSGQVQAALTGLTAEQARRCVIAYEPLWAIGTGKPATGEQANGTTAFIRWNIAEIYGKKVAQEIRIFYGGSVSSANAADKGWLRSTSTSL